jgi:primary-amine oxidase
MSPAPHPLQMLSVEETERARDIVQANHPDHVIEFRQVDLKEPFKKDLVPFLQIEHDGQLSQTTSRPPRVAKCHYDIIASDRSIQYHESLVDLEQGKMVEKIVVGKEFCPSLTL